MKKALFITSENIQFHIYFDGTEYFTIESFERQESCKFPLLDESGNQVFNQIDETNTAPVFHFEIKTVRRFNKKPIPLDSILKEEFEKNQVAMDQKEIDSLLQEQIID